MTYCWFSTLLQSVALAGTPTADRPVQWSLRLDWDWPLWATALLAGAAVAWVALLYAREASTAGKGARLLLVTLRVMALAVVAWMIAQPVLDYFRTARPRLVLLLDSSESMTTPDAVLPEPFALSSSQGSASESDSRSISVVTRLTAAQTLLASNQSGLLARLAPEWQLDLLACDQQFLPVGDPQRPLSESVLAIELTDPSQQGTRLGDAIDYVLDELPGQRPAAVVVLSDGIVTAGRSLQQAAQQARLGRVPLYTVAVGSEQRQADVSIAEVVVEPIVYPGDRLPIEATLRSVGYEGQPAQITIRQGSTAEVLATQIVVLPAEGVGQRVRFFVQPTEPGKLSLELNVAPLAEESNLQNNVVRSEIEVSDEKIRVLLVQASPSYEYRALQSMLQRDPAVHLRTLLQEADADFVAVDAAALSAFPTTAQELFTYDVVLLGDVDPSLLSRSVWPLLLQFVSERGGGLGLIAGPRFLPVAYRENRTMRTLLPIKMDQVADPSRKSAMDSNPASLRPTALGLNWPSLQLGESRAASEAIWNSLPPLFWYRSIEQTKPGAQVLAEHVTRTNSNGKPLPIIVRHYVGAGEVLLHATDETWRWRWQTDDRYFARYWGQVVRRLARGRLSADRQGVELTSDRQLYRPGESIELRARFRNLAQAPPSDQGVVVELVGPGQRPRQITLQRRPASRGQFVVQLPGPAPGDYQVRWLSPSFDPPVASIRFQVEAPPRELAQLDVALEPLRRTAEISGGRSYTLSTAARLPDELPAARPAVIERLPSKKLWNVPAVIGLLVLVLAAEWLLRRRWGML